MLSDTPRIPTLGLCPIGKFVFSHEDAKRYKAMIEERLREWRVPFVGIDDAATDGIVRGLDDVEPVVKRLRDAGADALFLPHCNFGTEHATGLIAQKLGLPTLLWGPRDEAPLPDGTRLRDSLCGVLASSKVLHKLGVPFAYIENCRVDDPALRDGLMRFLAAANVANKLRRGVRIGHIGQRIDFFWTTIVNESELLERFSVQVLPIDLTEVIARTEARVESDRPAYEDKLSELRKTVETEGFDSDEPLLNILALSDEMIGMAEAEDLDGFALQSFMSICSELGAMVEFSIAQVSDAGYPVACESDIHGAISSILLQAASFDTEPIFLADFTIRHPENDNGILLWHCAAPLSMAKSGASAKIGTHWILPGIPPGSCHWLLRDGPITTARFDGDRGEYVLAAGTGHTVAGPETQNAYVWMEVNDWPRWERQLVQGPFIHHTAAAYGEHADALMDACRFVEDVAPLALGQPSEAGC